MILKPKKPAALSELLPTGRKRRKKEFRQERRRNQEQETIGENQGNFISLLCYNAIISLICINFIFITVEQVY